MDLAIPTNACIRTAASVPNFALHKYIQFISQKPEHDSNRATLSSGLNSRILPS